MILSSETLLLVKQLFRPDVKSAAKQYEPDTGDTAPSVDEGAEAGDDPDAGDAAPYRAALHSPTVGSTKGGDGPGPIEATPHNAALLRPWTPDLDPELNERLRDTAESCTSPFRSPTPERPLTLEQPG